MKKVQIHPKIKKIIKLVWIIYAVVSFLIWFPKTDQLLCKIYDEVAEYVTVNEGWDIKINQEEYENVTLTEIDFEPLNKGDILVMSRTLSEIESGIERV